MLMTRDKSSVVAACTLALAFGAGCSSNANFGQAGSGGTAAGGANPGNPWPILGGAGPGLGTGGGASVCIGDFSDIACPTDYAAAQAVSSTCNFGYNRWFIGSCNGFLALLLDGGLSGSDCFYDPTSGAMVGARGWTDYAFYCDHTSPQIVAGNIPSDCPRTQLTEVLCASPDAGPDGGDAGPTDDGATDAGPCTGAFDAVAGLVYACPLDYASAAQWSGNCPYPIHGYLGSCNGFSALVVSPGTWGKYCYYDPSSGALVGAVLEDDVPSFCGSTSRSIAAGSRPSACPITGFADQGWCGTVDAGPPGPECSATSPCTAGTCVGSSCSGAWTCVADGRECTDNLTQYCGCDGVTFSDSPTCPGRPYLYQGACGALFDCDARKVTCDVMTPSCAEGQVPRVEGNCWGPCVPIDQCQCTAAEQCPQPNQYTSLLSAGHCSYYLP
jgi:hypothetical protein